MTRPDPRRAGGAGDARDARRVAAGASPAPAPTPTPGRPKVSVVVPTRERPALLARCLQALTAQDLPRTEYEILIVDDGAGHAVRDVLAAHGPAPPAIRMLRSGQRGPAAARNCGWRAARAPVIAFTDDDTIAAPNWLRDGLRAMHPDFAAVTGRVVVPVPGVPTDYERDAASLSSAAFVTANCFVRRDALEAVGGFDERFTAAWREDSDLHFALMQRNFRMARAAAPTVLHPVRPARWGISLWQQRKVMFDALLYRKHPRFYRRHIRSLPRWDYYLTVALLLAGTVALLLGHPRIAAAGLGGWTALTLAMTQRRLRGTSHAPSHVAEMLMTSMAIPPLAVFWRAIGAWRFRVLFL